MLDEFFLTDGPSAVKQQIFQNTALLARERQCLSIRRGRAAARIECQSAALQAHVLLYEPTARQAAHPRFQLLQMEGFGQIIVRTGIQSVHLVRYFTAGRQNEHTGFLIVLPQGAQNRHAVHFRQIQIEQH